MKSLTLLALLVSVVSTTTFAREAASIVCSDEISTFKINFGANWKTAADINTNRYVKVIEEKVITADFVSFISTMNYQVRQLLVNSKGEVAMLANQTTSDVDTMVPVTTAQTIPEVTNKDLDLILNLEKMQLNIFSYATHKSYTLECEY